jgi:trk system potassium uptake protein TrkA
MRYLIVGCGRVGSALAKLLDADGSEVIVVDENPTAFKRLGTNFRGHVVVGTGIDYDVLKRAGASTADGFVAVTNGDNRNIMAALIAQRMFKISRDRLPHLRSAARSNVSRAGHPDGLFRQRSAPS